MAPLLVLAVALSPTPFLVVLVRWARRLRREAPSDASSWCAVVAYAFLGLATFVMGVGALFSLQSVTTAAWGEASDDASQARRLSEGISEALHADVAVAILATLAALGLLFVTRRRGAARASAPATGEPPYR